MGATTLASSHGAPKAKMASVTIVDQGHDCGRVHHLAANHPRLRPAPAAQRIEEQNNFFFANRCGAPQPHPAPAPRPERREWEAAIAAPATIGNSRASGEVRL